MRPLFTTFAHGPPGFGLLLMRLAGGAALLVDAVSVLQGGPTVVAAVLASISIALGVLLLAGLWTPFAGTLVLADAVWKVLCCGDPWRWILLGSLGAALTLLGPGVWSIDARLFGWKRLEIRAQKGPPTTP